MANAIPAIQQASREYGVPWQVLASVASYESGLNPSAVGDSGHAYGLFQLNNAGGTITGDPNPQRYLDPLTNARYAAQRIASLGLHGTPSQMIADVVQRFERPAAPAPEIAGAQRYYQQHFGPGGTPVGVTPGGAGAPAQSHSPVTPGAPAYRQALVDYLAHAAQPGANPAAQSPVGLPSLPGQAAAQQPTQADPSAALLSSLMAGKTTDTVQTHYGTTVPIKGAPSTPQGMNIVQAAKQYLGTPYKWGGAHPNTGFDCSGFVQYLYGQEGISVPRTTYQQWKVGTPVDRSNLQAGDIVFFNQTKAGPEHEGLYIGNGQFIQSPHTGDVIKISNLSTYPGFVGARRVG